MSDVVILALIAGVPGALVALGTLLAVLLKARQDNIQFRALHNVTNSILTQRVEAEGAMRHAEGVLAGRTEPQTELQRIADALAQTVRDLAKANADAVRVLAERTAAERHSGVGRGGVAP